MEKIAYIEKVFYSIAYDMEQLMRELEGAAALGLMEAAANE